jgi:hypothetical protein
MGIQCAFHYFFRITFAAGGHVDNRFCDKLGDGIISVGNAHVEQGRFISRLHDLDFIGTEGTVSNQSVDRHRDPREEKVWQVFLFAFAKVESHVRTPLIRMSDSEHN